jgi:DNA invertase Pin-like site-specific DNA recombinase
MKTATAYARVSGQKQSETRIDTQLDDIKKFAKDAGIRIVEVFVDKITAADTKERPAFNDMIAKSLQGQFDICVRYNGKEPILLYRTAATPLQRGGCR